MPGSREGFYSQTEKTVNARNISGMLLCYKKKPPQARPVCGFVASSRVLSFAVIGRNTINIPETFQVFTVFPVAR